MHLEAPGTEVSPGVTIERRGLFKIGGAAAAALLLGSPFLRGQDKVKKQVAKAGMGKISLDEFIAAAEPLAKQLVDAAEPNEDAYLLHLASLLCRLDSPPAFEGRGGDRPVQMARNHRVPHFAVMQIKMAEGSALPYHDHYEYNGVILGLEGSVKIRNFEMVGDEIRPGRDEEFEIKETISTDLTKGRISTLSRTRDNIHDLRGGEGGGRVLDIFTFFPESGGSKYMEVEEEPVDAERKVYRASWRSRGR
jgi:hypothetical protein